MPCIAIAKSGKPCVAHALPAGAFCSNHDPKQAERRRAAGALRKPKPIDSATVIDPDAIVQRPRTLKGAVDTAWDHLNRVRNGEPKAIAFAPLVFQGCKIVIDGHKALDEMNRPRRGGVPVPIPGQVTPEPQTSTLIGEMVAARTSEAGKETVQ